MNAKCSQKRISTQRRTLKCTSPECKRSAEMLSWLLRPSPWRTPAESSCFLVTEAAEKSNCTLLMLKKSSLNVQRQPLMLIFQVSFGRFRCCQKVSFFPSVHLCFQPLCLWFHLNECHRRHRPGERLHFASPSTATNRAASGAPSQPIRAQESADGQSPETSLNCECRMWV